MTERDLRFAFHMDTGGQAMWDQGRWCRKDIYNGHPGSDYGRWLEEKIGNERNLRREFQFKNQNAPTYESISPFRYAGWSWRSQEVFAADYIYWLEEKMLAKELV